MVDQNLKITRVYTKKKSCLIQLLNLLFLKYLSHVACNKLS